MYIYLEPDFVFNEDLLYQSVYVYHILISYVWFSEYSDDFHCRKI